MALTKLQFRAGVNKEVTPYANKGGWVDSDKVRFRAGFPEKIGGWQSLSNSRFTGVCRAIFDWSTLTGLRYIGVGTNKKYFVARGGEYFDITPIDRTTAAGDVTFAATNGSNVLQVNDLAHGASAGDFVVFSGAVGLGGSVTAGQLNREYEITEVVSSNVYRVQLAVTASAADSGNGGAATVGAYQAAAGSAQADPNYGWGSSAWNSGAWGQELVSVATLRVWNHANYGEDLIYAPRGGALYYWDSSAGVTVRGTKITAGDAPTLHGTLLVSDASRFVICFGANPYLQTAFDPMLVRWSDREGYATWAPAITNQAGEFRLSLGSRLVCGRQSRQEILCWTDTALYSMRYIGAPNVFGFTPLAAEISIASADAAVVVSNVAYWMGVDSFYSYDGRVAQIPCALRKYVFNNINLTQADQFFAGSNEAFSEVWWFYVSAGSSTIDRYVVYNYADKVWYHGTMHRTAWWDSSLYGKPLAAFNDTILQHETGVDDLTSTTPQPIAAFIQSAPVDLGDGDRAMLVTRMLPDLTFEGSAGVPQVELQLIPQRTSGAPDKAPGSVGAQDRAPVLRSASAPVEQYTEQVDIRVRGRQIALRISSNALGVAWQLGTPRVDARPDGRRG